MSNLQQLPDEGRTDESLNLGFTISPISTDKQVSYSNSTIVSRIINIKNKLNELLHRDIKTINQAGLGFFEYLQKAENATWQEIDSVIHHLQKAILVLQKFKRKKIEEEQKDKKNDKN